LQAAASRDATPPRAVQARAGGLEAAALGPLGGEAGREPAPARWRTPAERAGPASPAVEQRTP